MEVEDGLLEEWAIVDMGDFKVVYGYLYYDRKERFRDGEWMTTSRIVGIPDELKQGDKVYTENSVYVLGVKER
jgi:hypothetical protein